MSKIMTPAMEKINSRRKGGMRGRSTPAKDAWRRLMRNKMAIVGMIIIIVLLLMAIFAPLIAPYGYSDMDVINMLSGPSKEHWFGTDQLGRDMLSRCIYGARITLPIAIFTVALACLFGGVLGVLCAYFSGQFDNIVMRILDIWGSIPGIMLSIAVVAALGNNMYVLVIGLSVGAVPNMARTFRGAIFTVVDNDYVEASRSIGAGNFRIMFKHLLPNAVGPVILAVVQLLGVEVLCVSMLSFLGVGVQPPTPEWGSLLSTGKEFLNTASYLCIFPGIFIVLTVLGFNLLGDGLRDALDPRLK